MTTPDVLEPGAPEPADTTAPRAPVAPAGRTRRVIGNPVLGRELAGRFGRLRTAVFLVVFVAIVGGVVSLVYAGELQTNSFGGAPTVTRLGIVGQSLFETTLVATAALVLFLVPGLASGAIAGERERQTLLALQVSLMRPRAIVLGKLIASLAFALLLIAVTAPLLAFSFIIGGVTFGDVLAGIGMLVVIAVLTSMIGVWSSATMRRTQTANLVAYVIVLLLVVGSTLTFVVVRGIDESRGNDVADPPSTLLAVNPIIGLADAVGTDPYEVTWDNWGGRTASGPLTSVRDLTRPDVFGGGRGGPEVIFVGNGGVVFNDQGVAVAAGARGPRPAVALWAQFLIFVAIAVPLMFWRSARRLRTPAATER